MKKALRITSLVLALLMLFTSLAMAQESNPQPTGTLLVVPEITITFGEAVHLRDIVLPGTTWDLSELTAWEDGRVMRFQNAEAQTILTGTRGRGYIDIIAPDGTTARTNVTVRFTFWQWIQFLFLGGFSGDMGERMIIMMLTPIRIPMILISMLFGLNLF